MNLLYTPRGRKFIFGALYLSEGAPIGFIWWALPTRLREAGVPVEHIATLVAVLVIPWGLKFLWAPLVDTLRSRRWTLRAWILSMQLLMGLSILPLMAIDPIADFYLLAGFLLVHAFTAATQDVAIDALCISVTPSRERGAVNGWMQVGMLAGRSVFGGGALIMYERLGEPFVLIFLTVTIWCTSVLLIFTRYSESGPVTSDERGIERRREFKKSLGAALKTKATWFGVAFALIGGAGYEAVGAVAGPFLIDRGFTSEEIGWFFAIPAVICMVGGALIGGYVSDKAGRRISVALFLVFYVAVIFIISMVDISRGEENGMVLFFLMAFLYLGIGLFTSSSYALFMDLTDVRLGATQFSAFMGMTNICESWAAFSVGQLIVGYGYGIAFIIMGAASLVITPVLRYMPRKET